MFVMLVLSPLRTENLLKESDFQVN